MPVPYVNKLKTTYANIIHYNNALSISLTSAYATKYNALSISLTSAYATKCIQRSQSKQAPYSKMTKKFQ